MLTRLAGKGDVREIGSGNIGATNVLRTGSKGLAAPTLMLDCLKATAAVLLAQLLFGRRSGAFAAAGAFIGHLYPVWLSFRGGKGVATLLGVLIALLLAGGAGLCRGLVWLLLTLRISSVAGMTAAISAPVVAALALHSPIPDAARFRVARALEAPREYPPPARRHRATHREGEGLTDDLVDRLRLIRTPGIGPVTYRQLLARFGSAGGGARRRSRPRRARRRAGADACGRDEAEREIERVEKLGARYLALGQGLYPRLLAELEDAPPVLIAKGDLELLDRPRSRSSARAMPRPPPAASRAGWRTISASRSSSSCPGLARGIDSAAHDGALDSGTIAVIAGGIDVVYPPENEARQKAIAERGLLIAEQPPGTEPRARHFPYRNRIIAGLSGGTVVVEAAPRSGSLITARLAAEAGREVMAVPGSPLDPRAQGCNQLIRDGATLIQNADDVLEAIRPPRAARRAAPSATTSRAEPSSNGDDALRRSIEDLLGPSPVPVDELIRLSGRAGGRGADGAARARPRRPARPPCRRQGQPAPA